MDTLIIHPIDDVQQAVLQTFLKEQKIPYEKVDETDNILANDYLVDKLNKGREDMKNGMGVKVDIENLWK